MAEEYEKAPQEIVDLVERIVQEHHHHLLDARIGVVMRPEAPISKGVATWGQASLISPKIRPLLKQDLDFIIWLAYDTWHDVLDHNQQKALVDHELCHCGFTDDGKPYMKNHDIEEFTEIVERHGNWRYGLEEMDKAMQQHRLFNLERQGAVIQIEVNEQQIQD